jgi:membrane protein DedA with SNARE-associated domain
MELFQTLFDWYMANLNYFTIALLMAIESTFIPLPSEIVVPFAAYKAAQGDLNVFLVVLFGTIGALTGSLINYTLAYYRLSMLLLSLELEKYFSCQGKKLSTQRHISSKTEELQHL